MKTVLQAGLTLALALSSGLLPLAHGCAVLAGVDKAGHPIVIASDSAPVIRGEEAIIIWDEAHKIEHFIRQADISTTAADVGFLVPTPQTPELAVADPIVFDMIQTETAPESIPEVVKVTPLGMLKQILFPKKRVFTTIATTLAVAASGPTEVEVIKEQDVANYHAAVLEAANADALARWLKDNGYVWSPEAAEWLKPYVTAKWKITAFKLIKTTASGPETPLQARAIRMSFGADGPFFPYSEPGDNQPGRTTNPSGRSLSLAVLSNAPMKGVLADGHPWPGKIQFAGLIMSDPWNVDFLLSKIPLKMAQPPQFLSYFEDQSNPRPGTADLYFAPNPAQPMFRRTVIDPNLPKEYRLDISSPLAIAEEILIPAVLAGLLTFAYWRFKQRA